MIIIINEKHNRNILQSAVFTATNKMKKKTHRAGTPHSVNQTRIVWPLFWERPGGMKENGKWEVKKKTFMKYDTESCIALTNITRGLCNKAPRGPKVNQQPLGLGNTPTESTTGPNKGWRTRWSTGVRDGRLPLRTLGQFWVGFTATKCRIVPWVFLLHLYNSKAFLCIKWRNCCTYQLFIVISRQLVQCCLMNMNPGTCYTELHSHLCLVLSPNTL